MNKIFARNQKPVPMIQEHEMNRIDRMSALISNFSGQFVHIFISTGL